MLTTIQEIIHPDRSASDMIADLKEKSTVVPSWNTLEKEYNPKKHPIMSKCNYPDVVTNDGRLEAVTRITLDLQRLAVKRTTELVFGIPVKRVYKTETEGEKEVAKILEAIFQRNRIDSVNIERGNMLFAGCEVATLWYAMKQPNNLYGFESPLKLRCKNYSPMLGDSLYPLYDENDDLIALSFDYSRTQKGQTTEYFDTYTSDRHLKWAYTKGSWKALENESITIMKIPAVYSCRPTPVWEDTSNIVYEMEWALSRNGNYLRKNSKPIYVVCADEEIDFDKEKDSDFKSVFQYPKGSSANYVTWQQAIENLKYFISELRQSFFTQLQLPDWSYENMKTTPMSGEARKQMFIDAQLKVKDESGRILEMLDREVNVVKAFLKMMFPETKHKDIEGLQVETLITPFVINDDKEVISNLMLATGGKAIMSQREGIENLGWSSDVDETMRQIQEESQSNGFEQIIE
jgi:hypothetical protein